MLSTFERNLFWQFVSTNLLFFLVVIGLFTVIDLFDNVDDFYKHSKSTHQWGILLAIVQYYGQMSLFVFDFAVIPLIAASTITSLLVLKKRGQVKPFLAAGVPATRVLIPPLMLGALVMIGLKSINREILLSGSAHMMHATRGAVKETHHGLTPRYDRESNILFDGVQINPHTRTINQPAFVLPPELVGSDMVSLKAESAIFYQKSKNRPSGWLMKNVKPEYPQLGLTTSGKNYVLPTKDSQSMFVVSDVSPDLVCKAKNASSFLSTQQLIRRISSPAMDQKATRQLEFNFHTRVVEPFSTVCMVLLAIPIVLARESRGLLIGAANCGLAMIIVLGMQFGVRYLSSAELTSVSLAAWLPLIVTAPAAVWMMDHLET